MSHSLVNFYYGVLLECIYSCKKAILRATAGTKRLLVVDEAGEIIENHGGRTLGKHLWKTAHYYANLLRILS